MVLAEKNSVCLKNGQRSRGPSPNGGAGATGGPPSPASVEDEGEKIRVGRDYQAICPDMQPSERRPPQEGLSDRALLVWSPSGQITDDDLDKYMQVAKEKYGYNGEQALGMLFWHKHDLNKATHDLANFTPFPDEWTKEDKVLFEQAFTFHGKTFHRIKQMLPDKSMSSLVKYYYTWKKTRTRTSLMDRQARKSSGTKEEASEQGSENDHNSNPSHSDSDTDDLKPPLVKENGSGVSGEEKKYCNNCGIPAAVTKPTSKGSVCNTCYSHWRHTGNMRPTIGPLRGRDRHCYSWLKDKWRPPRGMHIDHEDLVALAAPDAAGDAMFTGLNREIASLKRQVQSNKQLVSSLKRKLSDGADDYRNPDGSKSNARWSNEELALAVQGVRKYGKNFKAIAEIVGSKTEAHIRTFFATHRKRYNLDAVLREYEQENGIAPEENTNTNTKMDVDLDVISEVDGGAPRVPATV